jgi:EF-P beta-lysylation protein EpmB
MSTSRLLTRGTAPATWQQELASAITDPAELLRELGLDPALLETGGVNAMTQAAQAFPLRVPRAFVRRMRRGDPNDPLLRQVLARGLELQATPGFSADPLDEAAARRAPGLLQKYEGRALLVTTGACAVHCRYCFRREYDYSVEGSGIEGGRWEAAMTTLAADHGIEEVILSGGDPLSLGNSRLEALLRRLEGMPQLRRLRLHTRTPIVLPSRVDHGLARLLAATRLQLVIVVHANHAAEIDDDVRRALAALRATGGTLLNQSVLLAGVNDSVDALAALSRAMFESGTLPYYLHLLDRVNGVAHFEVDEARAVELLRELNGRLPGYLVPRLVREQPGMPGKTPLWGHRHDTALIGA